MWATKPDSTPSSLPASQTATQRLPPSEHSKQPLEKHFSDLYTISHFLPLSKNRRAEQSMKTRRKTPSSVIKFMITCNIKHNTDTGGPGEGNRGAARDNNSRGEADHRKGPERRPREKFESTTSTPPATPPQPYLPQLIYFPLNKFPAQYTYNLATE